MTGEMKPSVGVYVHIPFCLAKCAYCDFPSVPVAGREAEVGAYFRALLDEIEAGEELRDSRIDTVFIGGGTPTAAPSFWLARVLEGLRRFEIAPGAEITVEANPGTLTAETLRTLKSAGVNRLSIGLQAWQDRLLKTLGRVHTKDEFLRQYSSAAEAGFSNINVDLMFALPGQSTYDWMETLESVVSLEPRPAHISAYGLILEPGTPFWEKNEKGLLVLPDEETDRRMYEDGVGFLGRSGYNRYEISNFARDGSVCRHNMKYWRREATLGFGLGAHSFFGGARWNNPYDMAEYIQRDLTANRRPCRIPVPKSEAVEETVFLGLRLAEGIGLPGFEREFGVRFGDAFGGRVGEMASLGLLSVENGRAALTDKGFGLSEKVIERLLAS
ncbi:MAG: radical SAM family heme chaperone HemW [Firmicutes bacterium]|nr:radical SAM family heme chaperone HemW [Bacillota bacterium]